MIHLKDILAARERIDEYIYKTPLELSMHLSTKMSTFYLKLECQQKVKSFKIRGALSKITSLSTEERARGIMAVSSGNHGAGVSYAASLFGNIPVKVLVPESTPQAKVQKMQFYGAQVLLRGRDYNETQQAAEELLKEEKRTFIDPVSDTQVIAGQGTIALEILEENPAVDTVVVPVGGGGLITGIGSAFKQLKPQVRVIGVQTEACPAMIQSLKEKKWYAEYPIGESICDALLGGIGAIPYQMAEQCIDELIMVKEDDIRLALLELLYNEKVIAEPAGAIGVAAVMANPQQFAGKTTAIIVSGGNLDKGLLQELII